MGESEDKAAGPIKAAIEAIKTAKETMDPAKESRPGPLVIVARFYLSLIVIVAVGCSAAGIIDFESSRSPSDTVVDLRWFLMIAVGLGMLLGILLIVFLFRKNVLYLFNPGELSEAQQLALLPQTKEEMTSLNSTAVAMGTSPPVEAKPENTLPAESEKMLLTERGKPKAPDENP